ncbi:MAG: glycerate kinase [Bacteroidales bacterium]|nr:glycerate kinase [Bacteroidales bacterium]
MNNRQKAELIFLEGVKSVLPEKLIRNHLSLTGPVLRIGNLSFREDELENIYVVGAGKASAAMAHYVENILKNRIAGGHVTVKYGHSCKLKRINVTEAGHPLPDENGFRATAAILDIAEKAKEKDLLLCLISGGGSALMSDLPEGLIPEELIIVNNLLIRCGASIHEINAVRKHLSGVKGGQLARTAWPATVVSLILSDVIGNDLDVIASGPTVADRSTFADALKVIEKYHLIPDLTEGVVRYIKEGVAGLRPETPKPDDPVFSKTRNILVGSNITALEACKRYATDSGFETYIMTDRMSGNTAEAANEIVKTALKYKNDSSMKKPVCLLYGGETTLRVEGTGTGGRNQHMALCAASMLKDTKGITFLAAGTDGTDGPTKVAGAVVDSDTNDIAFSSGHDPEKYITEFDSYNFFRKTGGHIVTGPTFTNVMDIVVVLIE